MSITTALAKKREDIKNNEDGFTLIELLVVVIIIGILAAIAIPIYIGVQNNAKDSAVKSDLANDKIAIQSIITNTNAVPAAADIATPTTALTNAGWTSPASTTNSNYSTLPAYKTGSTPTTTSWCIQAQSVTSNGVTTAGWFNISSSGAVASGQCS